MDNYNSNPNQRHITTHKEPTDENNYYTKINLSALKKAMSGLSPKAFELWVYMSKNVNNHEFWLSKMDFLSWSNVKESSYYNAFNELVRCGYLVERKGSKSMFDFYESPRDKEIMIKVHKDI